MIFRTITSRSILLLLLILPVACKKDKAALVAPALYDGAAYAANTVAENAIRTALSDLSTEMKKGRVSGVTVNQPALTQLYSAGSPSLASVTSDYYEGRINGAGGWLDELARASGGSYSPGIPQAEGGVFGSYLFDENGLELEQLIEKGLYAAAMYNHAANLIDGPRDAALPDRLIAIFGAHPDFSNSDNASRQNPDRFSASYTARRDKNDGAGYYTNMQKAFIQLQAAVAAGDDYRQEQQEAIDAIRTNWEKAIFATVINYLHAAISRLSNTNPTEADVAGALHSYSEAVGFVHGWRGLPQEHRIITDLAIDDLLLLLHAPYDAPPASYKFATDAVNELPRLTQVIAAIQTVYGFTDQEIQDFKTNWVSSQGR